VSDPFLGEVRTFGFLFAPYQWATCNGATLNITQNTTLYSLLGTAFGGNGTTNFQLPNLAARMLCSTGAGPGLTQRNMGKAFGELAVRLGSDEIPPHNHAVGVYQNGKRASAPTPDAGLSTSDLNSIYITEAKAAAVLLSPTSIGGGDTPHENRQPFLALNCSIALVGQFPSFD
jgi:microcystin-dependent protein